MTHLTVEEIIEFVSIDKLSEETIALSTKVNEHIRSCPTCLEKVSSFQMVYDELCRIGSVSDVKQSIYRWRQSDWELLENQVQKDFEGYVDVRPLDTNFRSAREIVDFNNDYFTAAAGYLDGRLGGDQKVIQGIYSDVVQKSRKSYGGMVEVAFCQQDTLHEQILERIREAVDAGFRLGDITILVRLNKEALLFCFPFFGVKKEKIFVDKKTFLC